MTFGEPGAAQAAQHARDPVAQHRVQRLAAALQPAGEVAPDQADAGGVLRGELEARKPAD